MSVSALAMDARANRYLPAKSQVLHRPRRRRRMREIDFLPDWYRQVMRRRKRLIIQAACSILLLGALGLRAAYSRHHASVAAAATAELEAQIERATSQAHEVDRLLSL